MAATVCHCPAWHWYRIGLPGATDAPIENVALAGYLKFVKRAAKSEFPKE